VFFSASLSISLYTKEIMAFQGCKILYERRRLSQFLILSLLIPLSQIQFVHGWSHTVIQNKARTVGTRSPVNQHVGFRKNVCFVLRYHDDDQNHQLEMMEQQQQQQRHVEITNNILKASRSSFRHVEGVTDSLLSDNPAIALGIFVGLGLIVAYISGFAILDGYMDSSNPLENGVVPYWDEDLVSPSLESIGII
jgi:hypothetical protein